MKNLRLFILIVLAVFLVFCAYAQNPNHPEIVKAKLEAEKADKELNFVYKQLMGLYDTGDQKKLVAAQLAWLKYRDLSVESEICDSKAGGYPRQEAYTTIGTELTNERTAHMKIVIEKMAEKAIDESAKNTLAKIKKWESDEQAQEKKPKK